MVVKQVPQSAKILVPCSVFVCSCPVHCLASILVGMCLSRRVIALTTDFLVDTSSRVALWDG